MSLPRRSRVVHSTGAAVKAVLHRWEAVSQLCARLGGGPRQRLFHDYLDVALATTRAGAALLIDATSADLALGAERGLIFGTPLAARSIRSALLALVERTLASHEALHIAELARELPVEVADDLFLSAYRSALIVPAETAGTPLGAMLLLFDAHVAADPELLPYVKTLCRLLGLALQVDQQALLDHGNLEGQEDASRMASLGLLTASVAHELRGPAGALVLQLEEQRRILGQLEQLGATRDDAVSELVGELAEVTSDVENAVLRIRDTAGQLSTLTRRDTEFEELDLGDVVRASLGVARPHLERRGIELVQELSPACTVNGRRDNLGQLVLNLAFNAADACEQSGNRPARVTVRVSDEDGQIALEVADTGPGVPDSAIASIFKPFYTTKQRGRGTGLGLKIVSDVTAAHGGQIDVRNLRAGGACFRVVLPRLEGASGVHPVFDAQSGPGVRRALLRRKILIVDDDPVFLRTMRRTLKFHDVKTAGTASEAEIALVDPSYLPDLVLCDMCLPGTNGDALHSRIAELRPDLSARFVFVTGGGLSKHEGEYVQRVGCRTLLKPVDVKQLLDELLEPSRPEPAARRAVGDSRPPRPR